MAKMRIIATFLAVVLLLAPVAQAGTGACAQIKEQGELRVGIKTDSPPFGFVDHRGENEGFSIFPGHRQVTGCNDKDNPDTGDAFRHPKSRDAGRNSVSVNEAT
jgi:hypothetical protein